jgi:hypothetical protein
MARLMARPTPCPGRLFREERIKDTVVILLGNANAGVAHGQHDRQSTEAMHDAMDWRLPGATF